VPERPRLLLVGAGHAHLEVVRRADALVAAGYRVTLLAPRWFDYSGMASATATGDVPPAAARVDVAALAARVGIEHHQGTLRLLDRGARVATTHDGATLGYDVLSLNLGSVVAEQGFAVEGAVVRAKPLAGLLAVREGLEGASGARVTVVGGGATGVELAAHLAVHRAVRAVRLLEAGADIAADLPRGARRDLRRLLRERGVEVRAGCGVTELGADRLRLHDGTTVRHDLALLATGLVAPPLVEQLGLGDARGVPVRDTLQHRDHDEVYAVGDCAHFLPRALPRIGVHGVRQAPVLHRSLLARLHDDPLPSYAPQSTALAILDLGGGQGLAARGRLWWRGPSALRLKRGIDRRWLRRYQQDAGADSR
jgi:NADH dehydrogenase FAD-containing subunit